MKSTVIIMSKKSKVFAALISAVFLLITGSGLVLNAVAYHRQAKTNTRIGQMNASLSSLSEQVKELQVELANQEESDEFYEGDDVAQENDVRIAEEYVIRSTEHISDAYLSGDTSGLSAKDKETLSMASQVLDSIIQDGMSDYEKEKAVYEWMTTQLQSDSGLLPVIPDTEADCDNPYGVLKYHNAVCVGYATTFRLFMQMMEIPCMVVHNSEFYHSWDLVQLDGEWYHTDIYSDVGSASYQHFNIPDEMMMSMQNWNTEFFPAAEGYQYCYAYQISVPEEDIYHVPAMIREALDNREPLLTIRFDESIYENDRVSLLLMMVDQIRDRLDSNSSYDNMYMDYNIMSLHDECMLVISYSWYGEEDPYEPGETVSEEDVEKAENAVEEAFGDIPYENQYDW